MGINEWIRKHDLVAYFLLAFFFSWAVEFLLIFGSTFPMWLHYFSAFGPLVSAFLVTSLTKGSKGASMLFRKITRWDLGAGWFFFVVLSPIIMFAASSLILYLFNHQQPNLEILGKVNFLPDIGFFALLLWIITSGLGEETGWRGYALPRLQKHHNALMASIILGVFWALWHLPAFFYVPTYMKMGLSGFPMLAAGVICGSVFLTWLFNSTKGSVISAILWHGAFNFVTAPADAGVPAMITSTILMVWAVLIIFIYRPKNLSSKPRVQI